MVYGDHLKAAQRMTKKVPLELAEAPDCPNELLHLWVWFCQLPIPLTFTELHHWSQMTKNDPTADEIELLMIANHVYQKGLYG